MSSVMTCVWPAMLLIEPSSRLGINVAPSLVKRCTYCWQAVSNWNCVSCDAALVHTHSSLSGVIVVPGRMVKLTPWKSLSSSMALSHVSKARRWVTRRIRLKVVASSLRNGAISCSVNQCLNTSDVRRRVLPLVSCCFRNCGVLMVNHQPWTALHPARCHLTRTDLNIPLRTLESQNHYWGDTFFSIKQTIIHANLATECASYHL